MVTVVNDFQPRRILCEECLRELEYYASDIKKEIDDDYELNVTVTTFFIQCPICNKKIIFKKRINLIGDKK